MALDTNLQTKNATARPIAKLPRAIFPWPLGELIVPAKGCGLGDPLNTSLKNMAQPWREQIGYWIFQRDAGTGDLILPAKSTIDYFATGPSDGANVVAPPATVALGANWSANITNTNLFNKGAPVPEDFLFAAVAMGFSIGRPFALKKDEGGAYLGTRYACPWVDSYGARARDLMWSSTGFSISFKDSACDFDLGTPELYPPHAGQMGGDTVRAGGGFGLVGMLPIDRGPIYLGGEDMSTQARIRGYGPNEALRLCQDPDAATDGDLAVPVRVIAYGDFGAWCGPCAGPSADEIDALVEKKLRALLAAQNGK